MFEPDTLHIVPQQTVAIPTETAVHTGTTAAATQATGQPGSTAVVRPATPQSVATPRKPTFTPKYLHGFETSQPIGKTEGMPLPGGATSGSRIISRHTNESAAIDRPVRQPAETETDIETIQPAETVLPMTELLPATPVTQTQETATESDTTAFVPVATDTLKQLDTEHHISLISGGFDATPNPQNALNNPTLSILLIVAFLLIAISFRHSGKIFGQLFRNPVRRQSHADETIASENRSRIALLIATFLTEGILIYNLTTGYVSQTTGEMLGGTLLFTVLTFFYFLVQTSALSLTGYLFATPSGKQMAVSVFTTINALFGILAIIPVSLLLYYPEYQIVLLSIVGILFLLSRISFVFIATKIFFSNLYGLVYFILYLCAVEITPLLLIFDKVVE